MFLNLSSFVFYDRKEKFTVNIFIIKNTKIKTFCMFRTFFAKCE